MLKDQKTLEWPHPKTLNQIWKTNSTGAITLFFSKLSVNKLINYSELFAKFNFFKADAYSENWLRDQAPSAPKDEFPFPWQFFW